MILVIAEDDCVEDIDVDDVLNNRWKKTCPVVFKSPFFEQQQNALANNKAFCRKSFNKKLLSI